MARRLDAIVIGSGFGASVAAYELANAGLSVRVLERGKRYPPGSFPRSPHGMSRNFWDPSEGYYGLFDVWSFRHSEALVSSGLGGGSLIYANVLLRKPEHWFQECAADGSRRAWPVTRTDLDPHYDAVEEVLGATRYPLTVEPYSRTPKTLALRDAAGRCGLEWEPVNLAVTFAEAPGRTPVPGVPIEQGSRNLHGAHRQTCRLCGECDVGCNYGSKNTLDFNYLSMAAQRGAEINDLHEVRSIAPLPGGGYAVRYVVHDPGLHEGTPHKTSELQVRTIEASRVILGAGTLGSTYLLLKNRATLPGLSRVLGQQYSTNGDLLTFAMRCADPSGRRRVVDPSFGPVITSAVRLATSGDGDPSGGGFIEDAGHPQFMNWLVEATQLGGWISRFGRFILHRLGEWMSGRPQSDLDAELSRLLGTCELSAGSTPLLGMGRDRATGVMSIGVDRRGKEFLDVSWRRRESREWFDRVTDTSRRLAEAMGGGFAENPSTRWLGRVITVHPLGGCPMGASAAEGVVDAHGQVFGHPGLFVVDGAAMPGPVGSNPSLTIAAFARRAAHSIIREAGTPRATAGRGEG